MNLDAQVKNKFNISEILKKLLLRVNKLENTSSNKNFIPLTGTEEGKPITGDLKIEGYSGKKIKSYLQGEGGTAIDLTRVDEGLFLESYYGEGTDGVKSAELVVNNANVKYIPMNGAEETAIGFSSSIDHSKMSTGNNESDKLIYAQRSYVDKANSYSTDEIKTGGTWIDGKPIYRKCFVLGQITTGFEINHNLNIDTYIIKKLNGYLSGDKEYCSISQELHTNIGGINEIGFGAIQTATNLFSFENVSEITIENTVITLEYTKTTD